MDSPEYYVWTVLAHHLKKHVPEVEVIQRRMLRLINHMEKLSYEERLLFFLRTETHKRRYKCIKINCIENVD